MSYDAPLRHLGPLFVTLWPIFVPYLRLLIGILWPIFGYN